MNAKRIISFLLTLAIVLGLCPATFAADTIEVRSVAATVNGVAIGSSTDDITLTLDADANYEVRIDSIRKNTDDGSEPFSGTFGFGSYVVDLHFTPKAGYTFAYEEDEYIDYTILGENIFVEIGAHQDESLLVVHVHYTFGIIDSISVQLYNVAAGMPVKRITSSVPSGAKYYSVVHAVNQVVNGVPQPFSGTLEPGTTYEAVLHLMPGTGHTFADELLQQAIFCDYIVDSALTRQEPDLLEFVVEFYLPTPIHEVDLTVTGMEAGNSPADVEVTVPAGANYTVEIIEFVDENGDPFTGTLETDLQSAYIYLLSAEGCYFSEDMTVTVNGNAHYTYYIGEEMMVEYQVGQRSPIYEAEITVTGMEAGKSTADVQVTIPAGANYTVDEITIVDSNWDSFSGAFGSDMYYADISLIPAEGYYFPEEVDILLYGITPYSSHITDSGDHLRTIGEMDNRTLIHQVELTVTGMEAGKSAKDVKVSVPADAKYSVDPPNFYDEFWDDFTGTFEKEQYYASFHLVPARGYYFSYDTVVTLNGEITHDFYVDEDDSSMDLNHQLELRTPIDEVNITITGMEEGKSTADVKITTPAGVKYTVEEFFFYDSEGDNFTGTFEKDMFTTNIYLIPAEGCCFAEDAAISINGVYGYYFNGSMGSSMRLQYHMELRTPINEVDVTLTGIEEGKPASGVKVTLPAGVNYTLDELLIYDKSWNDFDGTFVKDRYVADIYLAAAEGYYFPEGAVITINDEIPYHPYNFNGNTLNLECHPDLRTPIDKLDITITGMEKGKSAAEISFTLPTGDKCQLVHVDLYDGQWEIFSGTFGTDLYTADIYLEAAGDYCFTEDLVATINGSAPTYLYVYGSGKNLNLEYELDLRTPISHVELPAWPTAPKAGSTVPELPAFGPAGYYCTPFWTTMDGDLEPGDQFVNNTVYYYVVTVLADYGFVYADDVTVTVGGEAYTGFTVDQGKRLFVYKAYPIGNAKLVDQINLSGTFPTAGKEPGEVIATGTGFTLEDVTWGVANNGNGNNVSNPTKPFQAGEYVYLAIHIRLAEGYALDLSGQIRFNGKVYSPIPQYSGIDPDGTIMIAICLGQVREGIPGDFTGDGLVTDADVIYLLWHTVFPEDYPIEIEADFTGDDLITDADVIYLLWHTVFPEDYPL